jgi:hypothetical protein
MPTVPLSESNAHLRDPKKFRDGLIGNVASSTAIETGKKADSVAKSLRDRSERRASMPKRGR